MRNSSKKHWVSIVCLMFTISIVLISLMISSEALRQDGKLFSLKGKHIRLTIQNNNDYFLGVHCKSGDKDIGYKNLKNGEVYGWEFRINFMNTTLFFCGFHQGQINKGVFEIFEAIRDGSRCSNCTWIAEKYGICGYSEKKELAALFYKWFK